MPREEKRQPDVPRVPEAPRPGVLPVVAHEGVVGSAPGVAQPQHRCGLQVVAARLVRGLRSLRMGRPQ